MARIAGVDIPAGKQVLFSLQYIYGIGSTLSHKIIDKAGVDAATKVGYDQVHVFVFLVQESGIGTCSGFLVKCVKDRDPLKFWVTRYPGNIIHFIDYHRIGYKRLRLWQGFGNIISY